MLRLRCPRCHTVQTALPGARPACPSCGFAGRAAPAPPPPRPAAGPRELPPEMPVPALPKPPGPEAWLPAPLPPPAAPERRSLPRQAAAAAAVALLLVGGLSVVGYLAGWGLSSSPALTQPPAGEARPPVDAEARLAAASAALDGLLRTGDLPGYRALESHAVVHRAGTLASPPRTLHNVTVTWGATGSETRSEQVLLFVANPAARTVTRAIVCAPDGRADTAFGQTTLSRPDAKPADCVLDRRGTYLLPFLPSWPVAAANGTAVAADGRVTLESGNATGVRSTLVLDPEGRLESLRVVDPARGIVSDIRFDPGARGAPITLPAGSRTPMPIAGTVAFEPGWWNLTVSQVPARAPLSEFLLQVRRTELGKPAGVPERIPLGGSGGGFEARVDDRDGDGMLSPGDLVSGHNPDFTDREQYAFGIYDSWAQGVSLGL